MRLNYFLLASLSSFEVVGAYSIALQVQELWSIVPNAISRSLYAKLMNYHRQQAEFRQLLQKLFRVAAIGSLCVALVNALIIAPLLPMLYGPQYAEASSILAILAFASLMTFSGEVRSSVFLVTGLTRFHFPSAVLGVVVLLGFGTVLIPRFGGTGAAVSLVVSYFASAVGSSFLFKETRWIGMLQLTLKIRTP
jgi:O-antigen/teichoic acid export membrane protein